MKHIALTDPLENTRYPNGDVVKSFAELSRNYLHQMLGNHTFPNNRSVKILYDDGNVTSNDICEAMLISCRGFGLVALIESEINFLDFQFDDVVRMTYNSVVQENNSKDSLDNTIKSIIVKDYETNKEIHGINIEDKIKCYIRDLNHRSLLVDEEYFEARRMYPCIFLIN